MDDFTFTPIAYVNSPYKQKFAIPRQPNLVPEVEGEVVLVADYADPLALRGLEQFSHLWLIFVFHGTAEQGWSPLVHAPRLGGHERVGVFASRSTHRPNPVGMSVVRNLGILTGGNALAIRVGGLDLLHGTPVLDIKPYLPYADSLSGADGGYAAEAPEKRLPVIFSAPASEQLAGLVPSYPELEQVIRGILAQDPRPAYRRSEDDDREYGISVYDLNIKWQVRGGRAEVLRLENGSWPGSVK